MEIKINIQETEIVDALVGAFEGGSNYWYLLPDTTMVKKYPNKSLSERVTLSAFEGKSIPVNDVESNEYLGTISKENIERGIKLYIEEGRVLKADEMDAGDSDILLQFIVLGEIVYG